jgi:hypothetical protein
MKHLNTNKGISSWAKITDIFFFKSALKIVENAPLRSVFSTILSPTRKCRLFLNAYLLLLLNVFLFCSTAVAQSKQGTVKGARTDKQFANTTEIHKTDKASDEQVLAEIEGDYGLGDMVHISNAPPISTFLPSYILPTSVQSINPMPQPIILSISTTIAPEKRVNKVKKAEKMSLDVTDTPVNKKEKANKKNDLRDKTGDSDLANMPTEKTHKKDESPLINTSNKNENRTKKDFLTTNEQKKAAIMANNKLISEKLASYNNNNHRTHRSTIVRYDTKKSGFPFFNKKRTSTMPKTVTNKKRDKCYTF